MIPIERLDMSDPAAAAEVWLLQHAAYAVEVQYIGYTDLPPLRDTIESLRACKETFFGIRAGEDGELVAAIACEEEGSNASICRLMVHPSHHRSGYASQLIQAAERHYAHCDAITVSTGSANEPAVRLYLSRGFVPHKTFEPVPGLKMTEFIKPIAGHGTQKNG